MTSTKAYDFYGSKEDEMDLSNTLDECAISQLYGIPIFIRNWDFYWSYQTTSFAKENQKHLQQIMRGSNLCNLMLLKSLTIMVVR